MILLKKRYLVVGVLALWSLFLSGCLVEVKKYYDDPETLFAKVEDEMRMVERDGTLRNQPPISIHLMVYENDSQNLVRIKVPFWLLEKFHHKDAILDCAGEFRDRPWANPKKIKFSLEDLKKMGPGTVLQVHDGNDRMILWLK